VVRKLLVLPLAIALAALPLLPAAPVAHAATTWNVLAGDETPDMAVEALVFAPNAVTIGVGDTITWAFNTAEIHTVTFVSGGPLPTVFDVSPLTGQLRASPEAALPAGPSTYDGTGYRNSGLMGLDPSTIGAAYALTFTQAGTYPYFCLIHQQMSGMVNVLASGTPPLDPAAVAALGRAQTAAVFAKAQLAMAAQRVTTSPGPGGSTIYAMAAGIGDGTYEVPRFLPPGLAINVGDTIVWTDFDPATPHTVTFNAPPEWLGPPPALPPGAPPEAALEFPPFFFEPTGGPTFSGRELVNSAIFGLVFPGAPAQVQATKYQLTFTAAGTFPYLCLLHAQLGMMDAITVRPAGAPPAAAPPPAGAPSGGAGASDPTAQAAAAASVALLGR
jgi:plastocyanin